MGKGNSTSVRRRLIFAKVYRFFGFAVVAFGVMGIVGAVTDPGHEVANTADAVTVGVVITDLVFVTSGIVLVVRGSRARTRWTQLLPDASEVNIKKSATPGTALWRLRTLVRWALLTPGGAIATLVAVVTSIKIPAAQGTPIIFYSAHAARSVFAQEAIAQRGQVAALTPDEKLKLCLASGESESLDQDAQPT